MGWVAVRDSLGRIKGEAAGNHLKRGMKACRSVLSVDGKILIGGIRRLRGYAWTSLAQAKPDEPDATINR